MISLCKCESVLGGTDLKLNQILKLSRGAVVELDKKVGDPVDLFVWVID
ncbi:MAG: FliM/FliN family flagellar motor switch protein [Candidatus Midichloria sp.]|nr:FliM/FliN family flagellar motor switch protein [Candidatus Midichloria sp.]